MRGCEWPIFGLDMPDMDDKIDRAGMDASPDALPYCSYMDQNCLSLVRVANAYKR